MAQNTSLVTRPKYRRYICCCDFIPLNYLVPVFSENVLPLNTTCMSRSVVSTNERVVRPIVHSGHAVRDGHAEIRQTQLRPDTHAPHTRSHTLTHAHTFSIKLRPSHSARSRPETPHWLRVWAATLHRLVFSCRHTPPRHVQWPSRFIDSHSAAATPCRLAFSSRHASLTQ